MRLSLIHTSNIQEQPKATAVKSPNLNQAPITMEMESVLLAVASNVGTLVKCERPPNLGIFNFLHDAAKTPHELPPPLAAW